MKRTWIKNARIVNEGKIFHGSIVIENEVIAEVLAEETVPAQPCGEIIDAKGYYLIPGVIDDQRRRQVESPVLWTCPTPLRKLQPWKL